MRIIEKHIIISILKAFIMSTAVFVLLYILVDTTSNLDDIIDRKVPMNLLVQYYFMQVPIIFIQTSSIACLLAVLVTYSTMNNNNEIIALRSSGLNFWQITKPALWFALIVAILALWVNERYVPQASVLTKQIRREKIKTKKTEEHMQQPIENLTFYGMGNRLYFIGSYKPSDYELNEINMIEYDDAQNIKQKVTALQGKWTGIAWKFYQVHITMYDREGVTSQVKIIIDKEKLMDIEEDPEDFLRQRLDVDAMSTKDLSAYIERFSNSGATKALNNLRVDLFSKIAAPIQNFVIVLIGLPFALMIKGRKRSSFTSVGIALAIGFLYYVINAVFLALGKGEALPPLLAAFAAPIIVTGIGIFTIESNF